MFLLCSSTSGKEHNILHFLALKNKYLSSVLCVGGLKWLQLFSLGILFTKMGGNKGLFYDITFVHEQ